MRPSEFRFSEPVTVHGLATHWPAIYTIMVTQGIGSCQGGAAPPLPLHQPVQLVDPLVELAERGVDGVGLSHAGAV